MSERANRLRDQRIQHFAGTGKCDVCELKRSLVTVRSENGWIQLCRGCCYRLEELAQDLAD